MKLSPVPVPVYAAGAPLEGLGSRAQTLECCVMGKDRRASGALKLPLPTRCRRPPALGSAQRTVDREPSDVALTYTGPSSQAASGVALP